MSEAGATAVQEIAFTFSNAISYLNILAEKGIEIDDIAPRISFFFAARMTVLEEIAKFRAARQVWATITKEQFGAKNPKSWQLRFHTQTAGVQLIAQNPELNIVRVALQSLGAVFGGTQSLHSNAFDEAIALPSDNSARIALQTQQVIMEETDLTKAIDPFKGSFLMENMTNQMVEQIERELVSIDALGGALQGIKSGYQMDKIEENAFLIAREVEDDTRKIVGLNFSKSDNSIFSDSEFVYSKENMIVDSFGDYKKSRNFKEVEPSLLAIREIASLDGALLPAMKVSLLAGATIGEICNELKNAWVKIKL
jgi:methylmalonyl-CoA mutase N-terminal domain/subunit